MGTVYLFPFYEHVRLRFVELFEGTQQIKPAMSPACASLKSYTYPHHIEPGT